MKLNSISIHLKALFYSIMLVIIVCLSVTSLLWICLGGINHNHIFLITLATALLSPRFEVISSQSGKSLKINGITIMLYNALIAWKKR